MDDLSFKHFLQELIDSSTTGDIQKLLVQASYFEEMTLSQQMEAGNIAKLHISSKLFLGVYRAVLEKKLLARRNPVLRKLLKEAFLNDYSILREAIHAVSPTDNIAVQFIQSCIAESHDHELQELFTAHINGNSSTKTETVSSTQNRDHDLEEIQNLVNSGDEKALTAILANAGKDVCFDIAVISKLSSLKSEFSWKILIHFLGLPSTKVRGYASIKLEEVGVPCADILVSELAIAVSKPIPDKAIAILVILKKVARREHLRALRKISRSMPDHINMRVALFETLVQLDPEGTAPLLVEHLCDDVDNIAYSAASLLDSCSSNNVIQGIENVIDSKLVTIKRLAEVIVFSKAKKLASRLCANTEFFNEFSRLCSLDGMIEYSRFFGLANISHSTPQSTSCSPIWAIDDSVVILRMYARFAVEAGVSISSFESGESAILALNEQRPKLIFVDLNMPGMSGIEFSAVLNEKGYGDIPRILVTTQEDTNKDAEITQGLFKEIVPKPFTPEILIKVINRYL